MSNSEEIKPVARSPTHCRVTLGWSSQLAENSIFLETCISQKLAGKVWDHFWAWSCLTYCQAVVKEK